MARTADTLKTTRRSNDCRVLYDPSLRPQVNVDAAHERCPPGQTVVRLCWCALAPQHVTVPGAFVPTVMAEGSDTRIKA
jgi:hypothetical protein